VSGANDNNGPFSIGQNMWPGLAKLAEECGEVVQIIGKLIATGGRTDHWSGLDLRACLIEEMGDVLAAVAFVCQQNDIPTMDVEARSAQKVALFNHWHGENDTISLAAQGGDDAR
jgi:NTP pyrophosphatase (non-canonical NTP hydrolase)